MPDPKWTFKQIKYTPGLQDSGDLEADTKAITATSKPGSTDYTTTLTIPTSPDALLEVLRTFLRLDVTIDSLGTGGVLHYSVEVDGAEKLSGNFASAAAVKATVDLTDVTPGAWSIGVFFWVDEDTAVVSVCQLKAGVGTRGNSEVAVAKLKVPNGALVSSHLQSNRDGASTGHLYEKIEGYTKRGADGAGIELRISDAFVLKGEDKIQMWIDTVDELAYLEVALFELGML